MIHSLGGRPYVGTAPGATHMLQPTHHVIAQDGQRGTPTPPARHASPNRPTITAPGSGKPATFHIQIHGSNDVIPVHIPVQAGGGTVTGLPRPASRGSPSAGAAYLIHTGMVMPAGSNMITVPVSTQRRTPSPKVVTSRTGQADVNNQRDLTPPPPVATSRTSPSGPLLSQTAMLVAAPAASSRNSASPRPSQTSLHPSMAPIPQLLITPAQAQLLGVAGCKLTPTQALATQKLATQLELNKVQQQVLQGPVAATITTNAMSQKVPLSSVPKPSELLSMASAGSNGRPRSVPSAGTALHHHHPPRVPADQQQAALYTTATTLVSSSLPQSHKSDVSLTAVRRLPVNTEPQRFFAANTPMVLNSGSDSWTASDRPQRPVSHPNHPLSSSATKSSNLRQSHELGLPGGVIASRTHTVMPNGIDVANANGDPHKSHTDPPQRARSPASLETAHNLNRQQTFVLQQSQLMSYRQQQNPHKLNQACVSRAPHRRLGKCHSEIPRGSLLNHSRDGDAPMPKLTPEKTIPPLISGSQAEECPQSRGVKVEEALGERLKAPFNMRVQNLNNFPATQQSSYRANYRSQALAIHRAKTGSITNAAKSLDLLRQNLQKHINQEIDIIIQRYMMYFKPGIRNIRTNNGESTVTDDHVSAVCRQILEEAKKMYGDGTQSAVPGEMTRTEVTDRACSPSGSLRENQDVRSKKINLFNIPKRRGSSDSDVSTQPKKKKKGRPPLYIAGSGRSTPSKPGKAQENVKREGPKWDHERLLETTKFIMGAKANKAMGLGNTRGRLYIKHPDIFKYSGDQDDKQWLFEHQHMPATGGKAYMLLEEDIRELSLTDEYRDNPGLLPDEIQGFVVPPWLIDKMKKQMQAMRSDLPKAAKCQRSRSPTPTPTTQDNMASESDTPLPFATLSDPAKRVSSPSNVETLDMLVTDAEDVELQDVSPYNMTGGFVSLSPGPASISPAPSDMDGMDDDTTPFGTAD